MSPDERRERLEQARLYFVCDGRPGGGDPGALLAQPFAAAPT